VCELGQEYLEKPGDKLMNDQLAMNGGQPLGYRNDWPKWPVWDARTLERLENVLSSQRWSISGTWTGAQPAERQFAERFAAYNGVRYCTPTANGTSALLIALEALDIGPGDEVLVPGLTWVACASAVLNANATPILVDVDPRTLCLDIHAAERAITPSTRAILAVHLYCSMVDMDSLLNLAVRHKLHVIEDCAQSHGSRWRDRLAGSMGDIGVFSMHQGKPLTSGEGGAAITNSLALFERLEQLRADGRRFTKSTPALGHMQLDETCEVIGNNYAMSEFQAAILLDALERLDEQNAIRSENAAYLDQCIRQIEGLTPVARPPQVERQTYYHYAFFYDPGAFDQVTNPELCRALEMETGVWFHPVYAPLNRHALYCPGTKSRYRWSKTRMEQFKPNQFSLPVAETAHKRCILFHHSHLLSTRKNMDLLVDALNKVKRRACDIPRSLTIATYDHTLIV
jgi:L-glutamine:2-deoxy-scyllo-inosose/3-amino-2,3-dideoxy-scyllo-inosose aminotransferase